jgi:hypothetical protein
MNPSPKNTKPEFFYYNKVIIIIIFFSADCLSRHIHASRARVFLSAYMYVVVVGSGGVSSIEYSGQNRERVQEAGYVGKKWPQGLPRCSVVIVAGGWRLCRRKKKEKEEREEKEEEEEKKREIKYIKGWLLRAPSPISCSPAAATSARLLLYPRHFLGKLKKKTKKFFRFYFSTCRFPSPVPLEFQNKFHRNVEFHSAVISR